MLLSLPVILYYAFPLNFFFYNFKKSFWTYDIYAFLTRALHKYIIGFFRLNSFLNSSIFLELNCFERLNNRKNSSFSIFYFFFIPSLGTRVSLNFLLDNYHLISSVSHFFQGLEWAEREISEMFGIEFLFKKDNRKLLLDYSFIGFPLLKSFPVTGLFELSYNFITKWLSYESLRLLESDKPELFF